MGDGVRYTVKQLAKLSGVSVRALHFYDEIGLLKPAYVGDNGYRYYENEQLLMLQQILFYRELGFPLGDIQKVLGATEFNKIAALKAHRTALEENVGKTRELIRTIDKTIAKLKGESTMSDQDLYQGFDKRLQKGYEKELVDRYGKKAEDHIKESKERTKHWKKEDWERVGKENVALLRDLVVELEKGTAVSAPAVQKIIQLHFEWLCHFWTPNREAYTALGRLYVEHEGFRKFYEPFHPTLAPYLAEAMKAYAENKLA